ncbi:HSP20-like chaperone [Ceratobasidium sp. AG-I]|nr:HSP20-like chaperone [Ceratobasidium sp. AG-I]
MSLTRGFFNDFSPLFRLVEDPQYSSSAPIQRQTPHQRQAVAEVTDEGKEYLVRAELPGVRKEDLDIHVGNDGRSLTIEGHVHRTNKPQSIQAATPAQDNASQTQAGSQNQIQTQGDQQQQEGTYEYRSTFSRSVWLPHAVDGKSARAELVDGVLTLHVPKRTESGRQRISLV